jgi:hypothetical protein
MRGFEFETEFRLEQQTDNGVKRLTAEEIAAQARLEQRANVVQEGLGFCVGRLEGEQGLFE